MIWLIVGLIVATYAFYQIATPSSVYATDAQLDRSNEKLAVGCKIVNPTDQTLDVIVTLVIISGHQSKTSNPSKLPPVTRSLTLSPRQTQSISFPTEHGINAMGLRPHVTVEVKPNREN
jgi:hypothetical protein